MPVSLRTAVVVLLALAPLTACGDDASTDGSSGSATQTSIPGPGGTSGSSSGEGPTGGSGPEATDTGDGASGAATPVDVVGTVVAEMTEPIALVHRPGEQDHVWVAERAGTVHRLEVSREAASPGDLSPAGEALLDISDQTSLESERGLLGLAFSADGSVLYVSHTDPEGSSKVAAYDVTDDSVDPSSRRELLSVEQPFPNHNGGNIVVTDDDALWLGLGDGGSADDPENRAQDPGTLLGKLVKVDTSGAGEHEIVASGLRNPWRFSFAPDDTVWIADVGQNQFEEINHVTVDDLAGANFGWSGYEGAEPYLDGAGRRPADPVMPVFTYGREGGNCSVTGGVPLKGDRLGLDGAYLFADYCAGRVRALAPTGDGGYAEHDLELTVTSPISFGLDADGNAYVLSATGSIVRIDPA